MSIQPHELAVCYPEMAIGVAGIIFGIWAEVTRRVDTRNEKAERKSDRDQFHRYLVGLKPSIQGANREDVLKSINDTLEWLKPPKKRDASQG
jgi:hypothetical protein